MIIQVLLPLSDVPSKAVVLLLFSHCLFGSFVLNAVHTVISSNNIYILLFYFCDVKTTWFAFKLFQTFLPCLQEYNI